MTGPALAALVFAGVIAAILARIPVAVAIGGAGIAGTWAILGSAAGPMSQLKTLPFDIFSTPSLVIVPLFLLMGQVATQTGLSAALFGVAGDWAGHRRGGMALAGIGASAGFGAICGSSLATASTMAQVALPEMRARGYSDALAAGTVAAGGTLGILIPPSVILVIYAIMAEANIVTLFAAALLPGLLATAGYALVIVLYVRIAPGAGPAGARAPLKARLAGLSQAWPVLAIFGLTMGGMLVDLDWQSAGLQALFTPNEAAAFGVVATLLHGAVTGRLTLAGLVEAILETARTTAMIFAILLGAELFKGFLALTQAPQALAAWVEAAGIVPFVVLAAMLLAYLIFGCVMDSLSMILLTVPVFLPVIEGLDFGLQAGEAAIWFGILALMAVEVGLITPPVGLNLFILSAAAPGIDVRRIWAGVLPFILSDILRIAILGALPAISLWLPRWLAG
ncbi:TRAP transporter large permease [Tropicimonas sp. IMCC34011]|uniref:TRAP transporter large permease n=1 Tax=Tropicimonas sp. IMCC34011 TaxID=2248759 RepID=UPI000E2875F8|nr:TRAP transporter large permease [Tropicimonas sp. IMCC34011]